MAIRDADGFRLDGDAINGVTSTNDGRGGVTHVERTDAIEKTMTDGGSIMVQAKAPVSERVLPRGLAMAPDGTIRNERDGTAVHSPTDTQVERAVSAQQHNLAVETELAARRKFGLSAQEIARGWNNDGSVVRDYHGVQQRVCGITVDRSNSLTKFDGMAR